MIVLKPRMAPLGFLALWVLPARCCRTLNRRQVKARVSFQGMGNAGFAWLEFQSNALQPSFNHLPGSFDPLPGWMKHHEVVGVANEAGLALSCREGLLDSLFDPV